MRKITIITGTTASGKSSLALKLAQKTDGVIVNADSVQLYEDLPILSASPDDAEKRQATHHLYNILSADEPADAADWINRLNRLIRSNHQPLILVGGTGLYLKAMIHGLSPIPAIDPEIRASIRKMEPETLKEALANQDPAMAARLKPNDRQRSMRALEVVRSTGTSLHDWQQHPNVSPLPAFRYRGIALLPERTMLRQRIHERMAAMIETGAVDEVRNLCERIPDPLPLPIGKTHGLREIIQLLDGAITKDQAIEQTATKVRQYAKRQSTWFRHQLPQLTPLNCLAIDPAAETALNAQTFTKMEPTPPAARQ